MAKFEEMSNTVFLDSVLTFGDDTPLPDDILIDQNEINDKTGYQAFRAL